jgi:phosphoribosylformimino-5-aminoimidazole carboxamide ribotide isomerase
MEIIPAVDIMQEKVVRLVKGDPKYMKSYEYLGKPLSVAKKWEEEGARIIHIVDLDSALGLGNNLNIIEEIVKNLKISIQLGGGIRNLRVARDLLNKNIKRIILGSLALREPTVIKILLEEFGANRIIVALDNINGIVMIHGWKTSTNVSLDEALKIFSNLGVEYFLVTSIGHDGTLSGPDLKNLLNIRQPSLKIIAAGGINNLKDIVTLKNLDIWGIVIGKALYEGNFSLNEALRAVRND